MLDIGVLSFKTPSTICVCIDQVTACDYAGNIWHQYAETSFEFRNVVDLIKIMEQLFDTWDFPQESTKKRFFIGKEKAQVTDRNRGVQGKNMGHLEDKKGNEGTFMVRVMYRQNSSWQGEVIWVEQKKRQRFRSALELLRLIDSAIEDAEGGREKSGNWNHSLPL